MIGNLDLYRIFNIVSQKNSFSQAAQELYMTQSAVSQAVMRLEKELEIQLFYRTSKGIILTSEGKLLQEYVQSALGMIQVGEEKLLDFKNLKTGRLRIGVGDTISRYYLLPYLEAFHEKYPGIKLTILNGTTPEIMSFLKSGKVDVGLCSLPIEEEAIGVLPCQEIQDIFVCGEKFLPLLSTPLSYETLLAQPLIFLENKSNSRRFVENYLTEQGHTFTPDFELGSYDLVLDFAKINLGLACVIKEFSTHYLESREVFEVPLVQALPKRSIGICYLKNVSLSQAVKMFIHSIAGEQLNTVSH